MSQARRRQIIVTVLMTDEEWDDLLLIGALANPRRAGHQVLSAAMKHVLPWLLEAAQAMRRGRSQDVRIEEADGRQLVPWRPG